MFIKIIKKIFMIIIALSMFVISVGSWRYQGDIHHMHTKIFKSDKNYSDDIYSALWEKYSQGKEQKIEMRKISIYDMIQRLIKEPKPHPSELIMDEIISSQAWSRFVPNSKSSTYPLSQKIWMSQNLTIKELMNYALNEKSTFDKNSLIYSP